MTNLSTTLLTPAEVFAEYGIPEATLQKWRYESRGPDYIKLGRLVRYTHEAIGAWLKAQTVSPGAA